MCTVTTLIRANRCQPVTFSYAAGRSTINVRSSGFVEAEFVTG
jgi:hypothetical protein